MKTTRIFLFVLAAILCQPAILSAQTKLEKKYALRAKEVDDEITTVTDPFFAGNSIPAEYANSSAVILAKKIDIFSDLKSKVRVSFFYGKDVTNSIRYQITIREKIKIQDKSALNEYSEISFNKLSSQSSFFKKSANTFIGISLIKPDGTVKKIDVDEEAVNAESEDDKDKYKLAVPGLQVGDVIDMYSRVEKESSSDNPIDPLDIVLNDDHPIVKYSFNTKIRNDFAVIYSAENGAQTPVETRDDDFIYLKVDFNNINKSPENLWLYDRREFPVFKINIFPGSSSKAKRTFVPAKGQVLKGMPRDWIDGDLSAKLSGVVNSAGYSNEILNYAKENIKKVRKERKWKETDKDSLINYIYYYGRFAHLYDYMSETKIQVGLERNSAATDYDFYSYLIGAFRYFDIDFDFILTVPRSAGTIHDVVSTTDFMYLIRAKGNNDIYLFPPNMYSISNSFPPVFEGQDAYVFKSFYPKPGGAKSVVEKLPSTKPGFNYAQEKLDINLDMANPSQLKVQRTRILRGNLAYDNQMMLSLFEEYVDDERRRLGERTFSEEIVARVGKKRGTQLLEEYKQAFAVARKKREEFAREEADNSFDNKVISFNDFSVLQTGNRHDQRDFSYAEKFVIDGLVKKAGANYIINIGSLVTGQVQVKTEDRTRKTNIHMPYARTFDYQISLVIPEGYSVEGIDVLNKNVENETGSFKSKVVVENGKMVLTVNKVYNHFYEPVSNWEKMLQFLDVAYDFSQQKILIRKL